MNKKFLLFIFCFVFVFQPLIAKENQPEKIHLVSLKCDGSQVLWYYFGHSYFEHKSFYYLDVYIEEELPSKIVDENYQREIESDIKVHFKIFYQRDNGRVHVNENAPTRKLSFSASEYELLNGYHERHVMRDFSSKITGYNWFLLHSGFPHSIKINRISLIATWLFDKNRDPSEIIHTKSDYDPYTEFDSYESQCSIAAEGDAEKWEKEINDPLEKLWKKQNQELIEEIREKRKI